MNTEEAIARAHAAFERRDFSTARRLLGDLDHPRAFHLLGLIERRSGNLNAAAGWLEKAAGAQGEDHELAHNRGLVAKQLGQLDVAEQHFLRSIELKNDFSQAYASLGRLMIDLERWDEAASLYRQHLQLDPQSVTGRYGSGIVQLETGSAAEAEALFDALILEETDRPAIRFMRGRARLELGELDTALADLQSSHASEPTVLSFRALANQYWMRGQDEQFTALIESSASHPELIPVAAEALRQSEQPEAGLAHLSSLSTSATLAADCAGVRSMCEIDCGKAKRAELSARACIEAGSANLVVQGALIVSLLMQGRAEQALVEIQRRRLAEPLGQHWIAYETIAYRLLGSTEYRQLADPNDVVRIYEIPTPRGFDNVASFNDEFATLLNKYHRYQRRPLDQSLRHGTQSYRNLVNIADPVFDAYFAALDGPISDYLEQMGHSNEHPLSMRNTGSYQIADCWSVRLGTGGYHTDHVHPRGWISSSYYVSVPDSEGSQESISGGSIRFGHPPFPMQPEISAEKWIQPKAGMVVLFPSYLWHGTEPISGGCRVTAPFDVLPA